MKKVFISTTSFAKDNITPIELLRQEGFEIYTNPHNRKLTENEMITFLSDIDFLIAGTEPLTRMVLESAKRLKIISRCGVGLDNIDLNATAQLGIKIFNTPYTPTLSVAELTIGLMLDLLRKVTLMDRDIKVGIWKKRMGNLLGGKKVGIIGFGRIGQKVAEFLMPFAVEIAYFDIHIQQCSLPYPFKPFEELLKWADIITIHCSVPENGKPIIGREELKKMKKGAWIINASRGGLVEEEALYVSLKMGYLSGAALDVYQQEPYGGNLKELDNVILTPHIGSYTKEGRVEMELQAVKNLLRGLGCNEV